MIRRIAVAWMLFLLACGAQAAQITQFSPQGRVAVIESIKVLFDVPVMRFGDDQAKAPMQVTCSEAGLEGHGRWVDARRWTYVFMRQPGPGVSCQVKVDPAFRTLSGEPLRGKTQFAFTTGGPQVIWTRPGSDLIDEDQVFVLRFNGAVKPETLAAHAVCVVQGVGEEVPVRLITGPERKEILKAVYLPDSWQDESLQLAQCKRRLPASQDIQLRVGPGVAALSGIVSDQAQAFDFTVREPFKASFSCQRENANASCTPILPVTLNFNAPVSSSLAAKIRLKTTAGQILQPVAQDDSYRGSVDYLRFAGPFPASSTLTLELPADLKDDAGRALSNADQFPLSIAMAQLPPLVKFAAAPFGVLERFANAPAGTGGAEPAAVPLSIRNVEASLRGKELAVSAGKVRDRVTQDDVEVLRWYARLQWLESGMLTRLQLEKVMAGQKPVRDKGPEIDVREFSALGARTDVRELSLPAVLEDDKSVPLEVIGIPVAEPGFHVLEVESARLGASLLESAKPMYVRTSALVTNLGVHLKRGRDDTLVWVTTLDQGKAVADAQINVLDCEGKVLASGKTDAQGIWHSLQALEERSHCESTGLEGIYVSARIPADHPQAYGQADFSFVMSNWDRGIESWRFNVPTDTQPQLTKAVHTVFDRSLLRAGETVSMKHFIRAQTRDGMAVPTEGLPDKVVIEHQGSGDSVELPLAWKPTPSGGLSAASSYAIPKTAKLGMYLVSLKGKRIDYDQWDNGFRVEEFKLPVLDGALKISTPDGSALLIAPGSLTADLQLSYVSGGPANGLPATLSAVVRNKVPVFQGYDDYSFGARDDEVEDGEAGGQSEQAQALFLDKKPVVLDAQGGVRTDISALPEIGSQPRELLFEATFADPNGEIQTLSQTATVWPASVVAGIRAGSWTEQGQDIVATGLALSPEGKPQADVSMSVSAVSRKRYSTRKRMVGGFYSYDSHVETRDLGVLCEGKTNAQGQLPCHAAAKESGEITLVVTARDAQGRVSKANTSVWVVGGDELWFGGANDDRIDIIPEKKEYAPGETAEFQVRMPFRKATALVAVEREGVLSTQVVELEGSDPRVRLTVDPKWGPNVYVSVLALRGRLHEVPWYSFFSWGWKQPGAWLRAYRGSGGTYTAPTGLVDLSKPAFRFGLAEIRVTDKQDQLAVKVSADKSRYQVRGKAEVTIQVSLPDGSPAANGQVAFAAVDEALLALSPNKSWDLLDAMRQRRSYGVETATAQMQVVGRRHYGRKALPAGGGGGKSPTRELLDTLLLWEANVPLDDQGMAKLTVPLNDAITSFKLVAVADYGAQRFGTGSVTIAATQDVQLISGLPALVREGDVYQAAVTVRNTTQRAMRMRVEAGYSGQGLPGEALAPQLVDVPAGAAQSVQWKVTVPEGNTPDASATLKWVLQAHEVAPGQGSAQVPDTVAAGQGAGNAAAPAGDKLAFTQILLPSVPISAKQSQLTAIDRDHPVHLAVQAPAGSLLDGKGRPRGGLEIYLQPTLAGGLPGVRKWFEAYPYTCLEQLSSKALGLRSADQWAGIMAQLPGYLDSDGLAGYFPGMVRGSEVLTAYLLTASNEAQALGLPFAIPEASRAKMVSGLLAFVSGKIVRNRWAPQNDLDVRKLMALEALSREGAATARMLGSLRIAPDTWPTSAVIDWLAILSRVPKISNAAALKEQAAQIIQARMLSRGTELVFADNAQNNWWWMMGSPEVNAAKLILTVIGQPGWDEDMPRLVQGLMARQSNGAWRTTTSNLMASLAMEKFARHFEYEPVSGKLRMQLVPGGPAISHSWPATGPSQPSVAPLGAVKAKAPADVPVQRYFEPWAGTGEQVLNMEQQGPGLGWASIRSLAAVPVVKPIVAGYEVQRKVVPITQAQAGQWSRGDVYRVQLSITAKTATVWAVLSDPVPAGATILGSGLGRDSAIAATVAVSGDDSGDADYGRRPSFVERSFEGFRAYYEYLPQGTTTLEYTVRLNAVGRFLLPPTRVEALYQPDVYGLSPNSQGLAVQDPPAGKTATGR